MWSMFGLTGPPDGVLILPQLLGALFLSILMYRCLDVAAHRKLRPRGPERVALYGNTASSTVVDGDTATGGECDAGSYLWKRFLASLRMDESGFKHQLGVLAFSVKFSDRCILSDETAENLMPFYVADHTYPWDCCKFATYAVINMFSGRTVAAKRDACRTAGGSLEGYTLPPNVERIRWPYSLLEAYEKAASSVSCQATALCVHVMDVEYMRNPANRPGTFAHVFVMTISSAGVYLHQAYGPRGYTLLQYMEEHDASFPLSLEQGKAWVDTFQIFAGDLLGRWTKEISEAYTACFDVDLTNLGCMQIGSQWDCYVKVEVHRFNIHDVQQNFALLPKIGSRRYPPCRDGENAIASRFPPRTWLGIPHYYIPKVLRCGKCGEPAPSHKEHRRCSLCKKIFYCSQECQAEDWKMRHKKVCKHLSVFN